MYSRLPLIYCFDIVIIVPHSLRITLPPRISDFYKPSYGIENVTYPEYIDIVITSPLISFLTSKSLSLPVIYGMKSGLSV